MKMKWIDFDEMEKAEDDFDETEDMKEKEEDGLDIALIRKLAEEETKESEADDEAYWALPWHVNERKAKEDNVDADEYYFQLPSEQDSSPRDSMNEVEEEFFAPVGQEKDIYSISEEEADKISLEEKRARMEKIFGVNVSAAEEKSVKEVEDVQEDLDLAEIHFEEMAEQMIRELQEEEHYKRNRSRHREKGIDTKEDRLKNSGKKIQDKEQPEYKEKKVKNKEQPEYKEKKVKDKEQLEYKDEKRQDEEQLEYKAKKIQDEEQLKYKELQDQKQPEYKKEKLQEKEQPEYREERFQDKEQSKYKEEKFQDKEQSKYKEGKYQDKEQSKYKEEKFQDKEQLEYKEVKLQDEEQLAYKKKKIKKREQLKYRKKKKQDEQLELTEGRTNEEQLELIGENVKEEQSEYENVKSEQNRYYNPLEFEKEVPDEAEEKRYANFKEKYLTEQVMNKEAREEAKARAEAEAKELEELKAAEEMEQGSWFKRNRFFRKLEEREQNRNEDVPWFVEEYNKKKAESAPNVPKWKDEPLPEQEEMEQESPAFSNSLEHSSRQELTGSVKGNRETEAGESFISDEIPEENLINHVDDLHNNIAYEYMQEEEPENRKKILRRHRISGQSPSLEVGKRSGKSPSLEIGGQKRNNKEVQQEQKIIKEEFTKAQKRDIKEESKEEIISKEREVVEEILIKNNVKSSTFSNQERRNAQEIKSAVKENTKDEISEKRIRETKIDEKSQRANIEHEDESEAIKGITKRKTSTRTTKELRKREKPELIKNGYEIPEIEIQANDFEDKASEQEERKAERAVARTEHHLMNGSGQRERVRVAENKERARSVEETEKKPVVRRAPEPRKVRTLPENTKQEFPMEPQDKDLIGVLQKRTIPSRKRKSPDRIREIYEKQGQEDPLNLERVNLRDSEPALQRVPEPESVQPEKKITKLQSAFEEEFQTGGAEDRYTGKSREHGKTAPTLQEQKVPGPKKKKEPSRKFVKELIWLIVSVLIVIVITFLLVEFVGQRTEVNGHSMQNTLQDGDNLIVDKISYAFKDPERFDIIVFPHTNAKGEEVYYIKRIIGMPGERVQISNGFIYINGEQLQESYGMDNELVLNPGLAEREIQLTEDEYFVLGDNRNNSSDSREIGNIKRDIIVGRAWFRIWPFSGFGLLKHQ